jgi:hypothetical protein
LSILLIIGAILSVASMLLFTVEFFFPELVLGDEEIEDPKMLVIALFEIGLGLLEVIVYLATLVMFLLWLYRSYENLPAFGVRRNELKYSSGWAVGSFFVPFVSLVVPYRAMKELWTKSVPSSGDMFGNLSPPGFFPLWWAVWLASNFANQIYFRLSWRGDLTTEASSLVGLMTAFLDLLASILALMVVKEIDRQQLDSEKLIPTLFSHQPPPPPVLQPIGP